MPRPDSDGWTLVTHSAEETHALGECVGRLAGRGSVILLGGSLGVGKTVLAQGIARGLGIAAVANSPTFVLVNEHRDGRLPLFHADLYRIAGRAEAAELALDEIASEGVLAVEWPERAADILPPDHLTIDLTFESEATRRLLTFAASGPDAATLLARLRTKSDPPGPSAAGRS